MLAYFYEIRMPLSKSASKNLSHIQSTAKHIFFSGTLNKQTLCYILINLLLIEQIANKVSFFLFHLQPYLFSVFTR